MAINHIDIGAPQAVVWDVLTDAASYAIWVVGSKRIRGVDPSWPHPGSAFHHTVGWGPLANDDISRVLDLEPPRRLVLEVQVWPLGTAEVTLTLDGDDTRTRVTMAEDPLRGPVRLVPHRLVDAAIGARNVISLRRLRAWSEQRYHAIPGVPPEPS